MLVATTTGLVVASRPRAAVRVRVGVPAGRGGGDHRGRGVDAKVLEGVGVRVARQASRVRGTPHVSDVDRAPDQKHDPGQGQEVLRRVAARQHVPEPPSSAVGAGVLRARSPGGHQRVAVHHDRVRLPNCGVCIY